MRYVVIVTSNDGGSGHICESREAVAALVRAELTFPDSNGEGLIRDEPERMERDMARFLADTAPGSIGYGTTWMVTGCDRWKERAEIAILNEPGTEV